MSRHVVFVTTEYDPIVPGGAGAVVTGLDHLLRDSGIAVTVVLVTDAPVTKQGGLIVVNPASEGGDGGSAGAASKAAFDALLSILEERPVDLIEFQDFEGLAFWTLTHRHSTPLETTPIVVRYHLPADHILDSIGVERPEFDVVRVMERASLGSADAVIVQTPSTDDIVERRYGTGSHRLVLGTPPVPAVGRVHGPRSVTPRLVVIGRLSEQKGTHDAVRALAPILGEHPDLVVEFVGNDGWSATADLPMREWVRSLAPDDVQDQIVFTDPIPRDDLPDHVSGAWAVLVPSRLESFCLAAHEARAMGLPLIARDLPAIADYFDKEHGALLYDGTDDDLRRVVRGVIADPAVLDRLAAAPLPGYGDPLAPYVGDLPVPRPPQSQAGLATASLYRFDEVTRTPEPPPGRTHRLAAGLLRKMPDRVARAAVTIVPKPLKERFRGVASWPEEQERRRKEERSAGVHSRIAQGAFGESASPRVSIIVPCYNHGRFLEDALVSVFEQTFASWEVVVVDDGSTDPETLTILANLDLPRVRVVRQENAGLPAARNTGIRVSRGEFIVPLDADDELLPDYLARMVEVLDAHPDAAFAHCWAELFGDVNWVWATRPYNPYTILLSNSVLQTATMRRKAWDEVGGYDVTMTVGNEDWDMWLRYQEAGWGNRQIRESLYRYRKQGISMSVTNEADFEQGRRRILDRHAALYEPTAIRATKAEHYPLLSLITRPGADSEESALADIQIVDGTAGRCDSIAAANGKYVVFLDGESVDGVWALVDRLEQDPSLAAVTDGCLTVYRRWELVDPGTGLDLGVVPAPERCPENEWIVPAEMSVAGRILPVVRQRPEEEGRLPAWVDTR